MLLTPLKHQFGRLIFFLPLLLVSLLCLSVFAIIQSSMPQTQITLEAGVEGGLFDAMSRKLAEDLKINGIDVTIVNRPDSVATVNDIADKKSPVDAGFIGSDAPEGVDGHLMQVGTVMLAPVYLIVQKDSDLEEIVNLQGRSVSLYPVGSAPWYACTKIFGAYGLSFAEEKILYGNSSAIIQDVTSGKSEAGCFVDASPGIREDISSTENDLTNENLRFLSIPQSQAMQVHKKNLRPTVIPSGSFKIFPPLPDTDIATIALSVTFVAKKNLSQELITMISYSFAQEYGDYTFWNQQGQFPSTNYIDLDPFERANDVYADGLPWVYQRFSLGTASFLDRFVHDYSVIVVFLFALLSIVSTFGLPTPYQIIIDTRPRRMHILLKSIDYRTQRLGKISNRDGKRLNRLTKWLNKESVELEDMAQQIRHIQDKASS
jgi:TRAP-type uncharacterized transport system substrate-binding protein